MGDYKELAASLNKQYGEGTAFILGRHESIEIPRWELDSLKISDLLGGGLPKSRIIEIYGPESSGKTSLCYYLAGQVQKRGGKIAIIDAENSTDLEYAETFGLKPNEVITIQPNDGEQALDIVGDILKSNIMDVIIIDSVAALTPRAFIEGEAGDAMMGVHARLMSRGLMKLNTLMKNSKATLLMVNQTRQKIGGYGNPETTTGGNALKFYSSVRLETRKKDWIWAGKENESAMLGMIFKLSTKKSKVSTPMQHQEITIRFGEGIVSHMDIVDYGVELGLIQKSGSWYAYGDIKIGQGIKSVEDFLVTRDDIYDEIDKNVRRVLFKKRARVPVKEDDIIKFQSTSENVPSEAINGGVQIDEGLIKDNNPNEDLEWDKVSFTDGAPKEEKKRGRKTKEK